MAWSPAPPSDPDLASEPLPPRPPGTSAQPQDPDAFVHYMRDLFDRMDPDFLFKNTGAAMEEVNSALRQFKVGGPWGGLWGAMKLRVVLVEGVGASVQA